MLSAVLPAALLAISTLPVASETSVAAATGERLSSAEIGSMLGASSTLPPNCWVEAPFGVCTGIVCFEGGILVLYDCDAFGH